MRIQIQPLGDLALRVSFEDIISESINRIIQQFIIQLQEANLNGIVEWVPTYTTITIFYKPEVISYSLLVAALEKMEHTISNVHHSVERLVYEIPVYYGGETGPDLSYIANYHDLTEDEVISLHSSQEYLIYMMGFVPGFPYLGGLSQKLAVPRLEHPRPSVSAGSVGIGGFQTGIYPSQVPSGWRIIGITPVNLFDINQSPPSLLSAGNYIKFVPIDFTEYVRMKNLENYHVRSYQKKG
jgi:inhibitor of KinA